MPPSSHEDVAKLVVDALVTDHDEEQNHDLIDAENGFLDTARWIPRAVSPFLNLDCVIDAGVGDANPASKGYERNLSFYNAVIAIHPGIAALLAAFQEKEDDGPTALSKFISKMNHVMRDARSQDTNTLKTNIISYLPADPDLETVAPPITGPDKSKRGWNHKWTARALCPLKDLEKFDRNPASFMKEVQDGKIKLKAKNFPSFVYPAGTVYDPAQPDQGLFRGHVLIRSLRLIFTGNSSALSGHRSAARSSQAELHGMRKVTPATLAYAVCQAYINLSSTPQWASLDSYFDLEKFHSIIISLFTNTEDPWAEETLGYLTSELPALSQKGRKKRSRPEDLDDSDDEDPTGIFALRSRRAEEAARVAEEAEAEARRSAEEGHASTSTEEVRLTSREPAVPVDGQQGPPSSPPRRPPTPPQSSPLRREETSPPLSRSSTPAPQVLTQSHTNQVTTPPVAAPLGNSPSTSREGAGNENEPPAAQATSTNTGARGRTRNSSGGVASAKKKRKSAFS